MKFFWLLFLFLWGELFSFQERKITINKLFIIENLENDSNFIELREETKKHIKNPNLKELKFYLYQIKPNEDFYYVLAKTSSDHTTLLSLNGALLDLELSEFQPNQKVILVNHRGYFTKENSAFSSWESWELEVHYENRKINIKFSPNQKNLEVYHQNFQPPKEKSITESQEEKNTKFIFPIRGVNYEITSSFGWRKHPLTGKKHFHRGIDIKVPLNTPIYAPSDGWVEYAGSKKGYGETLILKYNNTKFLFAHLTRTNVKTGDKVQKGQIIGYTGTTGASTGPHLHLEYKVGSQWKNPLEVFFNPD
ncbi:MAG: M23 family metallopeptidase [Leptospiraceae bacterium]|nr:M23 family metallopeptidase [Leptospiraceae bacterium]MDW7975596.1 M23 family metallopeptidase [Leptospiraceae bacterium]